MYQFITKVLFYNFKFFIILPFCHSVLTGYGAGFDDVIVHGDLDAFKFAAFYTK